MDIPTEARALVMPGSFESSQGRRDSRARRRSEELANRGTASLQESVVGPERAAIVRAINANICPFCGRGPFKNLGTHTNPMHGVSAADLRLASGLERVCSDELSDESRIRWNARPDREATIAKRHERAHEAMAERAESVATARLNRFYELGGGWRAVGLLSLELGIGEKALRSYLEKWGAALPDGRVVTDRRRADYPTGISNRSCRSANDEQVSEIRRLAEEGLTQRQIADHFGIGQSSVSRILRGKYVGDSDG